MTLKCIFMLTENILSRATFPGGPSYGGVRTWVEGSQTCGNNKITNKQCLIHTPSQYKSYRGRVATISYSVYNTTRCSGDSNVRHSTDKRPKVDRKLCIKSLVGSCLTSHTFFWYGINRDLQTCFNMAQFISGPTC